MQPKMKKEYNLCYKRDTYMAKDYTCSIIPVHTTINSGNQCGITTILGLNDANNRYIQIKYRSKMVHKATMIYYKSLPNCPTKDKT
ncbi:hypothetical protein QVD17_36006 [Tagetes erecta]|uniref:Uncharacterized protein n=1 Tax=Tagetes erecta TaxID=13708 RepID=A0AAD8JXQ4_TARER|nr:hypothetical protein QVD17_36006 [Tagetes erecta]